MALLDNAKKVLQALYDEYIRTGDDDYCNAQALSGLPSDVCRSATEYLMSLGYVKNNTLGETKLTDAGKAYMEH